MTVTVEEIQSLVVEIGTATTRAGYSGDDCPQAMFPTILSSNNSLGLSSPSYQYSRPVLTDPVHLQTILQNVFDKLQVSPKEFPLFIVDSPMDSADLEKSRQALIEVAFEQFEVPAVYFGKSSVMSMFAMGRHTGLALECGAAGSSVIPVYEGIPLSSAASSSAVGGNYVEERCLDLLKTLSCYEDLLTPYECIKEKRPVGLGESPTYSAKPVQITDSYRLLAQQAIVRDFKENVVQIAESANVSEKDLALRPPRYYEFPCGFNKNFGAERFKLGESLFTPDTNVGIIDLIKDSLSKLSEKTDGHLHPQYHHHVTSTLVVSGGATLTFGFMDRLNFDLQTKLPLLGKIRVQAATTPMERKLSPWLGGSILASLGTMQSFWLTKAEYAEHGASILSKKFP